MAVSGPFAAPTRAALLDVHADPGYDRFRAWDRVREDLVERQIGGDRTPCLTLGLNWTVCPVEGEPVGLRLIDDEGRVLQVREEVAEARVRELEELLRRAQGGGSSGAG